MMPARQRDVGSIQSHGSWSEAAPQASGGPPSSCAMARTSMRQSSATGADRVQNVSTTIMPRRSSI